MKKTAALLLALLMAMSLFACGGKSASSSKGAPERSYIAANFDADRFAYLAWENGGKASFTSSPMNRAYITADRQHIIALSEDGELCYYDSKMENKTVVAEDCSAVVYIRNDGFFYYGEDSFCRFTFASGETLEIPGTIWSYSVAENTTTILYSVLDNSDGFVVNLLPHNAAEPVKVGSGYSHVRLDGVSDDGSICSWEKTDANLVSAINDGASYTPIIYYEGERHALDSYYSKYSKIYTLFTADQKLAVAMNTTNDTFYIAKKGADLVKVKMPDTVGWIFCANGYLVNISSDKLTTLYVAVKASEGYSLYAVSLDGEKERILSKIHDFDLLNGTLIYETTDKELYCATVNGANLTGEKKIASDIYTYRIPDSGNLICYLKNYDSETSTYTLYGYKLGDEEPAKISANVDYSFYFGTSGTTVFYVQNPELDKEFDETYGALYKWTYSSKNAESVKIADNVITGSLTSNLDSTKTVNDKDFFFCKFTFSATDDETLFDLVRYDGKEATTVFSDLVD